MKQNNDLEIIQVDEKENYEKEIYEVVDSINDILRDDNFKIKIEKIEIKIEDEVLRSHFCISSIIDKELGKDIKNYVSEKLIEEGVLSKPLELYRFLSPHDLKNILLCIVSILRSGEYRAIRMRLMSNKLKRGKGAFVIKVNKERR